MLYDLNVAVYSSHICLSTTICATFPLSIVAGARPEDFGLIHGVVGATTAYATGETIVTI